MIRRQSFYLWLFLALFVASGASQSTYAQQAHEPQAHTEAIVTSGNARFTVLTPHLIRMEWASDGQFEDHASLVFIDRRQPVPQFETRQDGEDLVIETDALTLRYERGSGRFAEDNLEVTFSVNNERSTWHPGMENEGNLEGTTRTLDGVQGETGLGKGLISREGWVVVDDTDRPLFDDSDWPWAMPRPEGERQDWYFFGHGHDYKQALRDFTKVAGDIPMPPRYAFGKWWSHYWAYTDQEFMDLVRQYEQHNIPLDVLVVDMDWHKTLEMRWWKGERDQADQILGWTGYTWNPTYFPDPEGFLEWTERHDIKVPLNLHPASGIQPHEAQYEEMARAMGIDPETEEYVPFDIVNKDFAKNYFDIVIHPLEEQGVDFWWLDWQQWSTTDIEGVTPTWWLNYVFFTDMARQDEGRPLIFHRWGGLGNHRYQVGFSGDARSDWESLTFQPYFTSTAANVGFGYWSHDIGGHYPRDVNPELYTRWVQFGIFSPILRTHATKDPRTDLRLWAQPEKYASSMRDAVLRRYAMVPYIYTAARQTYDTGVAFLRPLYYDFPEADAAYDFENQYMFGDDMMVAPITQPISEDSLLAAKEIWIPEGEWIEWDTGTRLSGPQVVTRSFALDEVPVYVRAGSVIPMQSNQKKAGGDQPTDPLVLTVFPGGSHETEVYADAGNSLAYKEGEFARTPIRKQRVDERTIELVVEPTEGSYPGMASQRSYEVRLPGSWPAASVTYNGRSVDYAPRKGDVGWRYDGSDFATVITLPEQSRSQPVRLNITFQGDIDSPLLDGMKGKTARIEQAMQIFNNQWKDDWSPETFIDLYQTGQRIQWRPETAQEELRTFHEAMPEELKKLPELRGDSTEIQRGLNHLHALQEEYLQQTLSK